ncbi:MAG: FixH family protein [Psychroflexus sp.]
MKLNWGTSIVIAFVLFIGFIMFMVVQMMSNKELEHDLVVESYYQKELTFQNELDEEQNAADLDSKIEIKKSSEGLLFIFPKEIEFSKISGEVFMYRPSDKALDFTVDLKMKTQEFIIPEQLIQSGRWNVNLKFKVDDKSYLVKKEILF